MNRGHREGTNGYSLGGGEQLVQLPALNNTPKRVRLFYEMS